MENENQKINIKGVIENSEALYPNERDFLRNTVYISALTFDVYLTGSDPKIWRRFVTKNDITLHEFHLLLKIVMGWQDEDGHIYEFDVHGLRFEEPDEEGYEGNPLNIPLDSTTVKLAQIVNSAREKFYYRYDRGDDWYHEISIVSILPLEKNMVYPQCIGGEGACPPENIGGIESYYDMLSDLKKGGKKAKEITEWLEECGYKNFDPLHFDIEEINIKLRQTEKS